MNKRTHTELNLSFLNNFVLEDEIYSRIDKLQALCAAQLIMDASDAPPSSFIRTHYTMIIEEQLSELRKLLNQLFA